MLVLRLLSGFVRNDVSIISNIQIPCDEAFDIWFLKWKFYITSKTTVSKPFRTNKKICAATWVQTWTGKGGAR